MTPKVGLVACLLVFAACHDSKEDEVETIDKAGSIESSISVQHADSTHDVILTTHKVWVNFSEYKTVVHADTVPSLGLMATTGENENGDTARLKVKKDYQIFITMK